MNRRKFLKNSLTLTAGTLALQNCAYSNAETSSSGSKTKLPESANNKLNVALIGVGGAITRSAFKACNKENVVCMADVDDERAGLLGYKQYPDAKRYKDFRRMLDKHDKELDAVIISTPDHVHFSPTYASMERGIAVHTQKPLTHNIWQARVLQKAAHKYNVPNVMGNQGHTFEGIRLIREWYEAGLAGEVKEVHAWTNRSTPNNANAQTTPKKAPIPETLDWDLWLGPVPFQDYSPELCPTSWRWWWDFGLGGLGDIGCHTLDIPMYALGLGYPDVVYTKDDLNHDNGLLKKNGKPLKPGRNATTYVYEFPARGDKPPVTVYWYEGGNMPKLPDSLKTMKNIDDGGCLLVGDKNTIVSPGMRPNSPRLLNNWMEIRKDKALPPKTIPRAVGDPVTELFAEIKGEIDKCGSDFDYAVPLTEIVILGTIAFRTGKSVEYLPDKMTFKDSILNEYIKEPVRSGWEYGEDLIPV